MSKTGICIDCGKQTCRLRTIRCRTCSGIYRRKYETKYECQRAWTLKKKYNMTLEDFEVYWNAQRGKCFICNIQMKLPERKQGQSLDIVAIDHNHKTGKIRALLCNKCNKGLGFFNDNINLMKEAIKYLEMENE